MLQSRFRNLMPSFAPVHCGKHLIQSPCGCNTVTMESMQNITSCCPAEWLHSLSKTLPLSYTDFCQTARLAAHWCLSGAVIFIIHQCHLGKNSTNKCILCTLCKFINMVIVRTCHTSNCCSTEDPPKFTAVFVSSFFFFFFKTTFILFFSLWHF